MDATIIGKATAAGKRSALARTGTVTSAETLAYVEAVIARREADGAAPTHAAWVTDADIDAMLAMVGE